MRTYTTRDDLADLQGSWEHRHNHTLEPTATDLGLGILREPRHETTLLSRTRLFLEQNPQLMRSFRAIPSGQTRAIINKRNIAQDLRDQGGLK